MADGMQKDWRELCEAVTKESDSTRLSSLVQELIEALDRGERSWRRPIPSSDPIAANRDSCVRAAKQVLMADAPPPRFVMLGEAGAPHSWHIDDSQESGLA